MSSQKAEATIWWLSLLLTFTVVLVQPRLGQAQTQLLPPIPLGIIPYFPGLLPPATAPTPLQCWIAARRLPVSMEVVGLKCFHAQLKNHCAISNGSLLSIAWLIIFVR
ncbi:hypothetical protein GOBAR_AA31770 [Gossypium barbadense]|uniref:Prolamin-like domain-containing protein n=1 Tax=Gossypium barbadense TaxID=3634 RepID=A0A2P5WCW2_GOSBA|nr:hypothetical protein GOBAR_AA31770 [Gossypium barbadense]